jgi:glycosyltransferase involved in cell wall biosynthesis
VCKNLTPGPALAPQVNDIDPGLAPKDSQSHSSSPKPVLATLPVNLILQRPDDLVLTKLAVVIPTKNGISEGFESAMKAISRQRGIAETEITVVDSGSSDGTPDVARRYGAKVLAIRPEDFNHGTTRNYGADQTTSDLIMFTVQDAIPASEDLFYQMAKALLRDPKLAGVSVRQIPRSDADLYACWERWNHNRFHLEGPQEQLLQLAGLDNVCSMVKRNIWEKVRFPTTDYAEDLEFGLACLRQGYKIAWLSERATIHSHNRSPFFYMSRHFADSRVMSNLLKNPSPAWVGTITLDQLFAAVKASYLALTEFVSSIDCSVRHEPRHLLRQSCLSLQRGSSDKNSDRFGDPTLSDLFQKFDGYFETAVPETNPCILPYEESINSILKFIGDRYPTLTGSEIIALIYKAFAAVGGSVFGKFFFPGRQREDLSNSAKQLGDVLALGYRN